MYGYSLNPVMIVQFFIGDNEILKGKAHPFPGNGGKPSFSSHWFSEGH